MWLNHRDALSLKGPSRGEGAKARTAFAASDAPARLYR
jgi:hypothetical protein